MKLARGILRLVEALEKLPGIGPKTAQRLSFYLLHNPQTELDKFSEAIKNLKKSTQECEICFNVDETNPCQICLDKNRDRSKICVVEQAIDVLAIERGGFYRGLYHVLGGSLSPLNNIGPNELRIMELIKRLKSEKISELILATNPNMEGEATALYLAKKASEFPQLKVTRIGRGLPIGADLEYADEATLNRSFEGRREM